MNIYNKALIIILPLLFLLACSVEPKPINYGQDNCDFCAMTIMENKFAAEVVTSKGKVFKFDAIECMIRYVDSNKGQEFAYLLISDYSNPGELVDAETSTYLISKNLSSPMGAFLSAYSSKENAQLALSEKGGTLYNWEHIQNQITNK